MEWLLSIPAIFMGIVLYCMGREHEADSWRLAANREYRTAIYSRGQFYYVVPEQEYLVLDILRLKRGQFMVWVWMRDDLSKRERQRC